MKIWLDDLRTVPSGYVGTKSVNETIRAIEKAIITGTEIELLDLDHDLGDYAAVIVKIVVSKSCFLLVTCFIWVGRCYPEIRPAVNTKTSCCASIDSWSYLRVSDIQAR